MHEIHTEAALVWMRFQRRDGTRGEDSHRFACLPSTALGQVTDLRGDLKAPGLGVSRDESYSRCFPAASRRSSDLMRFFSGFVAVCKKLGNDMHPSRWPPGYPYNCRKSKLLSPFNVYAQRCVPCLHDGCLSRFQKGTDCFQKSSQKASSPNWTLKPAPLEPA